MPSSNAKPNALASTLAWVAVFALMLSGIPVPQSTSLRGVRVQATLETDASRGAATNLALEQARQPLKGSLGFHSFSKPYPATGFDRDTQQLSLVLPLGDASSPGLRDRRLAARAPSLVGVVELRI